MSDVSPLRQRLLVIEVLPDINDAQTALLELGLWIDTANEEAAAFNASNALPEGPLEFVGNEEVTT
jgi:hypothetical protein